MLDLPACLTTDEDLCTGLHVKIDVAQDYSITARNVSKYVPSKSLFCLPVAHAYAS